MNQTEYQALIGLWGPLGVLAFTFIISLVPFASPSNALMAALIAMSFPNIDKVLIGVSVALGATLAKAVHFSASYGIGKLLERKVGDERIGKYGRVTLYVMNFIAAATPLPDEWIVIPMGLGRMSPLWFFLTYLAGKLLITIPAAYIGQGVSYWVEGFLGGNTWIFSLIIGVVITMLFVLIDFRKLTERLLSSLKLIGESKSE
ncbi:MAG: hypothetical protein NZ992_02655 [Candidatus Korarchaeum sp.]|nr:hypothetical protein [Candidatus Korarchaeum sp.]MDW8036347.1 hypothetical protein [Candidatus Korarchaeum sp.]